MPNYTPNQSGFGGNGGTQQVPQGSPYQTPSQYQQAQWARQQAYAQALAAQQAAMADGYNRPTTSVPQAPSKKKRGVGFWAALGIAVVALVAAAFFGVGWWIDSQPADRSNKALEGQLEGKSYEEIQAELDKLVEEGMLAISIASEVEFEDGQSEGAIKIENSPANNYLIEVDIARDDTGEVIYRSGILEPNTHIQEDRLDVNLLAGTYDCTATFQALDPDTEENIGQAAAKMVVKVLN